MARLKLFLAKLTLTTTVLAAAAGGAYYFTSGGGGWLEWLSAGRMPTAQLEPDATALTYAATAGKASDLDAVAQAWIEQPAPAAPQAVVDDRYAVAQPVPTPLAAVPEALVARGQDDQDTYEPEEAEYTEDAAQSLPTYDEATDSQEIAQRARAAFDDSPPAEPSDRYGSSRSTNSYQSGSSDATTREDPFSTQPQAMEVASQSSRQIRSASPALPEANQRMDDASHSALQSVDEGRERSYGTTPEYGSRSLPRNNLAGSSSNDLGTYGGADADVEGTGRPGERSLEGPQQPSLVIQKFAPEEIQVGKSAKFAVQVRNLGNRSADEVIIRDEVPQGTQLISSSPGSRVDGSHIVWELGTLSAGEEQTVEMQLMPTAEGELGSVATVSYATPASVKTRCTMPQLAIRMTAPSEVMIGGEQHVKIQLRNPGTGDATGVMLYENVPEGVRHEAGPTLEFEIGTLHAGETRELDLILKAEKPGHVVNVLKARADGSLQVQQELEFDVIAPALAVAVHGPSRRYLERPATYQVLVENPGSAAAKDIEIVTKLPKGMRFVRANNMGEYDSATHAVYWSLAELPEGERGSVELVAMPIESGQQTIEVESRAQQGLSDQTMQNVVVEGLAAIMFTVTDLEDPIEVGGETTYEIRVVNQGTKAATNVQVELAVPSAMQVVSASGETHQATQSGGVRFEPLAQLPPKAEAVYQVQVQGVRPGDQRVAVQVNCDDISQPIRKEESTRIFGDD